MVLPGDNQAGMLETLLCETFRDEGVCTCIDTFFKCVEEVQREAVHRPYKARALRISGHETRPSSVHWGRRPARLLEPGSSGIAAALRVSRCRGYRLKCLDGPARSLALLKQVWVG